MRRNCFAGEFWLPQVRDLFSLKVLFAAYVLLFCTAKSVAADSFTDAIQDLVVQIACTGQYSAAQAGGGWYDDPQDFYIPAIMAKRFVQMSGRRTRTETFYGVCFDYAEYAYRDIEKYHSWYVEQGMQAERFYIAGVDDDPGIIQLMYPVEQAQSNFFQNGIPVRIKDNQYIYTHKSMDGKRAVNHAWLWIYCKNDNRWYWIDPTWTDNVGYVVWGYVDIERKEEIQLRPDKKFCVNYPEYLERLPASAPPASAPLPQPSAHIAQTPPSPPSSSVELRPGGYRHTFGVGVLFCPEKISERNKIGFSGFSLSYEDGNAFDLIGILQIDCLFDEGEDRAVLFNWNIGWQFGAMFGLYAGAGVGCSFSDGYQFPRDDFLDYCSFAWKVNGGIRFMISRLAIRCELSYVGDSGFMIGAFTGINWD